MDRKKLESLFGRYRDPSEPDKIGMEGVVKFLDDLQLDPSSRLVISPPFTLYLSVFSFQDCSYNRLEIQSPAAVRVQ